MILESGAETTIDGERFTFREPRQFDLSSVGAPIGGGAKKWAKEMEPGDLLFFRHKMPWWKVVSRAAASSDGFFSHVAIYVGDGLVVDSSLSGVKMTPLKDVEKKFTNQSCVVVCRPLREKAERTEAANWARFVQRPEHDPTRIDFDTAALASAFVILSKLRLRTFLQTARVGNDVAVTTHDVAGLQQAVRRAIERMEQQRETFDDPFETQPFLPGVCAGFVWQTYARTSARPIAPALLVGSRIQRGDIFGPPNLDPSLLDLLLEEAQPETFHGALQTTAKAFGELTPILKQTRIVMPALIGTTIGSRRGTVLEMVGPGDLYCSADVAGRRYLTTAHQRTARDFEAAQDPAEHESAGPDNG